MAYGQLIGILGVIAIALCWVLAVVLYRVGNAESAARKLSVLLAIEGVVLVTAGFPEFATGLGEAYFADLYGVNKVSSFLIRDDVSNLELFKWNTRVREHPPLILTGILLIDPIHVVSHYLSLVSIN